MDLIKPVIFSKRPRGENHANATHVEKQIHSICKGLAGRLPYKEIAIRCGMEPNDTSIKFISDIKNKVSWTHISDQYDIPVGRNSSPLSDEQVHSICKCIEQGLDDVTIVSKLGLTNITKTTMYNIRKRRRYNHITSQYNF